MLEKPEGGAEHVLTGAILCFPSNWTLAREDREAGSRASTCRSRATTRAVARRVQRLFDVLRPEAPLMRANLIPYAEPDLFNPRHEFDRHTPAAGAARFVRVERQVLLRLPVTGAVVFSIHVYQAPLSAIEGEARAALMAARPAWFTA